MNYYIDILKKYKDFSGRASRKEFWMFFLFIGIITVILSLFFAYSLAIWSILNIFFILIMWSVAVRRLHDTNHNGAWALILLIPSIIINILNFFVSIFHINPNTFFDNAPDFIDVISIIIGWVIYPIVAPIFFISALITIVYLFRKGQSGENKYGLGSLI